jgi:nucleotide-binding universal stress UspA family protein
MVSTREALGLANVLAGTPETNEEAASNDSVKTIKTSSLIHLGFFIEVPRSMPLSAPFAEEEDHARRLLTEAEALAAKLGLRARTHIIRARNTAEEIIEQAAMLNINTIVLSLPPASEEERAPIRDLVRHLLMHARCEVMIKRVADAGPLI